MAKHPLQVIRAILGNRFPEKSRKFCNNMSMMESHFNKLMVKFAEVGFHIFFQFHRSIYFLDHMYMSSYGLKMFFLRTVDKKAGE